MSNDVIESGENIEPAAADEVPIIRVRNLVKTFGRGRSKKYAVNRLNLTMYDNQIFCLLGHNGAGKSTTISMLTGLLKPNHGDAYINGFSIAKELASVRESMGVCPQKNTIYPNLSVLEHVKLVALLKGLTDKEIAKEAPEMVRFAGLEEKMHTKAQALSGGMKRKLCLAMALVGGSKVIFLDEPTSGMDPQSRRGTWELLQSAKKGRLIVLTTHFMDEADLLGDRIAVMSAGKLNCVGSSLFLKQRYGVGYTLTLAKQPNFEELGKDASAHITRQITKIIPAAAAQEESSREMYFRIPTEEASKFPKLFEYLDKITEEEEEEEEEGKEGKEEGEHKDIKDSKNKKHSKHHHHHHHHHRHHHEHHNHNTKSKNNDGTKYLLGYGVSMTTLEHVFVKLAELNEVQEEETQEKATSEMNELSHDKHNAREEAEEDVQEWDVKYPTSTPLVHYKEMIKKRFINARRDIKNLVLSLVIPILVVILVLAVLNFNPDLSGDPLPLYDTSYLTVPKSFVKLFNKESKSFSQTLYTSVTDDNNNNAYYAIIII